MTDKGERFLTGLIDAALAAGWRWVDGAWESPDGVRYERALYGGDQELNPGPDPLGVAYSPGSPAVPVQGSGSDPVLVGAAR